MAHDRELSEQPLVVLDADKLFGMRQIAPVSVTADSGDRGGMASRAQTSRLLSKIGETPPAMPPTD